MLWGLTALLIPILVHLLNLRRHKLVYFSNTATLKNIQQESARTKKLKHLVLLFLRCLFIIGLVLAFAFPFRPDEAAKIDTEEGVVGVYIDNSMSMKALSSKTSLIEEARELSKDLVNGFPPSTRFLLMSNSFEVQNEYPMSQQEMLDRIDRMRQDGPPTQLNGVLDRFNMIRKVHGFDKATIILCSDFQEHMLDLTGLSLDSSMTVIAIPLRAENRANLAIDTVWLGSPILQMGMANDLHVVVTNYGDREVKGLPVNLQMDGKAVASNTLDVPAGGAAEMVLQLVPERSGDLRCAVSLMDYPITFDDTYRFVIGVKPKIKIVELSRASQPSPVALLFDNDPQYDYTLMSPIGFNLDELSKAHLIVVSEASALNPTVRQALLDDAKEGASIAFFHDDGPSVDTNAVQVSDLALQQEFFSDIIIDLPQHADLPQVQQHVPLSNASNVSTLMHLANGDPLLTEQSVGKGHVYDFATTLDRQWSNLADNSLFVPLMLKMAFVGNGIGSISYIIGEDKSISFNHIPVSRLDQLTLKNEDGSFVMSPARESRNNKVTLFLQDELPEAGYYELMVADSLCQVLAFNDNRLESDTKVADNATIEAVFKEAGVEAATVVEATALNGSDMAQALVRKSTLWRWLVLLALLAVFGEIAVLRFWK